MNKYDAYIYLLFALKVIFILLAIANLYMKTTNQLNTPTAKNIAYWKSRVDFVFTFLMSLLLIYLFYPSKTPVFINDETRLLIFLFGIILIVTAEWSVFFTEARWFTDLQQILSQPQQGQPQQQRRPYHIAYRQVQ